MSGLITIFETFFSDLWPWGNISIDHFADLVFGKLIKTDYAKYSSKYYIYTEAHILEQKTKCCSFLLFCCILYLINPVFREKIEMLGINVNIIQPGTKYMGHSTRLHIHGIPAFGIYYNWQKVSQQISASNIHNQYVNTLNLCISNH